MRIRKHQAHLPVVLLITVSLVLTACGGTPPPAATEPVQTPVAGQEETPEETRTALTPPAAATETETPAGEATSPVMGESERSRTVIFDTEIRMAAPTLWNPFAPGFGMAGFNAAMWEPLFILNYETGEIEPWLGESMTSNESLDVWTLKLREGIKWSDGEDFNADDVVFTINMLKDGPAELQYAAPIKEWVESVEKVDDRTVRFTLTKPSPRFQLDLFTVTILVSTPIVPEHIWKGKDPVTFQNYDLDKGWPVFTGPYTLASSSPTEVVYERDPDWWGAETGFKPLPTPERLVWTVIETEDVRVARAADHQLDSVADMTLGAFEALRARNPDIIAWYDDLPYAVPDPCERNLEINNAIEPWGDKDLRWALNYAIDRDQIVAIAYEGTTQPAKHFFPAFPSMNRYVELLEERGLYEKYPITTHDPEKARQVIESKGYTKGGDGYYQKDGQQLRLRIDAPNEFIELKRIAQVIVEQLQAVGINATQRNLAFGTFAEDIGSGKSEAAIWLTSCGSVVDPWPSMSHFLAEDVVPVGESAPNNWVRWENQEYSAAVNEMGKLPLDDPRVDELFVQASEEWMEELPFIPVAQARKLIPFDTYYWTGWPSKDNNYIQPYTWGQTAHKIIHNLQPTGR